MTLLRITRITITITIHLAQNIKQHIVVVVITTRIDVIAHPIHANHHAHHVLFARRTAVIQLVDQIMMMMMAHVVAPVVVIIIIIIITKQRGHGRY